MFAFAQLRELEHRLRNRKVRSVFVDTATADPAGGSAVAGPDEVTGRLDAAMGGIAATLPSPLVGSSNAGTSSHATPACGFVACR